MGVQRLDYLYCVLCSLVTLKTHLLEMASRSSKKTDNEDFVELDVKHMAREAEGIVEMITKYASEGSNPKQLAIGGVSGWVTGYVAMKIGKTVATAVGGSLILLQLAHHKGYISVNWSKVNKDLEGASNKLAKSGNDPAMPKFLNKAADYLDDKAEKASRMLIKKKSKAHRWYRRFVLKRTSPEKENFFIWASLSVPLVE